MDGMKVVIWQSGGTKMQDMKFQDMKKILTVLNLRYYNALSIAKCERAKVKAKAEVLALYMPFYCLKNHF